MRLDLSPFSLHVPEGSRWLIWDMLILLLHIFTLYELELSAFLVNSEFHYYAGKIKTTRGSYVKILVVSQQMSCREQSGVKQERNITSPQRTSLVSMAVGFCVCWNHLKQLAAQLGHVHTKPRLVLNHQSVLRCPVFTGQLATQSELRGYSYHL